MSKKSEIADTDTDTKQPKLSEDTVKNLPAPTKGNRITYFAGDKIQGKAAPSGFGVRVTASGSRAFIINYRNKYGLEKRLTIGRWPDWTVLAAVVEARKLRQQIDTGDDPLMAEQAVRGAPTVGDMLNRFVKEYLPLKRPSSARDDMYMISGVIRPKLGRRKVADVRFADVDALHRAMRETPFAANRVLGLLSRLFTLAIKWEWLAVNPAKGVERFYEPQRERYLDADEISRLNEALDSHDDQRAANVIRLLMLTGARKGEALQATWSQFDITEDEDGRLNGTWTKPGATTKQKTDHRVQLSNEAVLLLRNIRASAPTGDDGEAESEFVFPSGGGDGHLVNIKRPWGAIRKIAGISDVRIHDLRHTFASIGVSAGHSLYMVGQLLGHINTRTTQRYAHLADAPLKKVTDSIGAIISGKKSAKVTPIRKDGAA